MKEFKDAFHEIIIEHRFVGASILSHLYTALLWLLYGSNDDRKFILDLHEPGSKKGRAY